MTASFDWNAVRAVISSDGWAQSFTVEPPVDETAAQAVEAQLGRPLPEAYRAFVCEVAGAISGLHLNGPAAAVAHLVGDAPAARSFPFTPAQADAAMTALAELLAASGLPEDSVSGLWQVADRDAITDAMLGDNPGDAGALLALDLGCAEYVAVVADGPLRGTVWRACEDGWYPEFHRQGERLVPHDFASFMRVYVNVV